MKKHGGSGENESDDVRNAQKKVRNIDMFVEYKKIR